MNGRFFRFDEKMVFEGLLITIIRDSKLSCIDFNKLAELRYCRKIKNVLFLTGRTAMKEKLPIGIQSFSQMIEEDYVYIDKTKYILDLIKGGSYYFLSRPRRFGKSLLLSTLHEIFSGKRHLFDSLDIAQSDYNWPEYPVVHMSFASMNVDSPQSLLAALDWTLQKQAEKHNITISDAPTPKLKFIALIERLAIKSRVVILIDEYDHPIINNLKNLALAEECRQELHNFLIVLKDLADSIKFVFITGVSRLSKTSIFSGLNNLNDLTLTKNAALLVGYTEREIRYYFNDHLHKIAEQQNISFETLMGKVQEWYNGYRFVEESLMEEKIYNPTSVLFYLYNAKFLNYWADTGTPSFVAHFIKNQNYPIPEIDGSCANYNATVSYELDKLELIPLLWQTEYLTIRSYNPETQNYTLTYPNREIRESFLSYLLSEQTHVHMATISYSLLKIKKSIANNDLISFFKHLGHFFADIPYTIQIPQEKYYQSNFYMILRALGADVQVEVVTNNGRIDAVLESSTTIYLFEFKIDSPAEQALQQIIEKQYYQKYVSSSKQLVLVGAEFSSETRNIKSWVAQEVAS